jgi:hypothetical protein
MIIHARWVLAQELKWLQGGSDRPLHEAWRDAPRSSQWLMFGAATLQTAVISGTPYYSMIKAHEYSDYYMAVRRQPAGFTVSSKGIRALGWGSSRSAMLKLGAAKLGTRFIPYVGWGLLAYDLWSLGKWIGEKTS